MRFDALFFLILGGMTLAFIIPGAIALIFHYRKIKQAHAPATATVVSTQSRYVNYNDILTHEQKVKLQYFVDGKEYVVTHTNYRKKKTDSKQYVFIYSKGNKVKIRYNPEKPTQMYLEDDKDQFQKRFGYTMIILGIGFFVVGCMIFPNLSH